MIDYLSIEHYTLLYFLVKQFIRSEHLFYIEHEKKITVGMTVAINDRLRNLPQDIDLVAIDL